MSALPPDPDPERNQLVQRLHGDAFRFALNAVATGYDDVVGAEALLHAAWDITSAYDFPEVFDRFRKLRGVNIGEEG